MFVKYLVVRRQPSTSRRAWYYPNMTDDTGPSHYYVRATHATTGEQVRFGQLTFAAATAKAAELRMRGYRDVVMSISEEPPETIDRDDK